MTIELRTLCLFLGDFAREESARKDKQLNVFLLQAPELDSIMKDIVTNPEDIANNIALLFRANQLLERYAKGDNLRRYAEDAQSLGKLRNATKMIRDQIELCLNKEEESQVRAELLKMQEQMKRIHTFLQKRENTFQELIGFRIGRF